MTELQGYGFVSDSDESLKSKSGGVFGLNAGNASLVKFAYNPNVAKEGDPVRDAIEIIVKIGDRESKDWINPITKVVDKDNNELTDTTSEAYKIAYNALMNQQAALTIHYVKATGVTEAQIKAALQSAPIPDFATYAQRMCALLPAGYENKALDVFLEYQWNFGKKQDGTFNDKTYPTLPKNMKGGYFIIPAQPGIWVEKRGEDGSLTYVNSNGAVHPFDRSANFMKSNKGKQQGVAVAQNAASPMQGQTPGVIGGWGN